MISVLQEQSGLPNNMQMPSEKPDFGPFGLEIRQVEDFIDKLAKEKEFNKEDFMFSVQLCQELLLGIGTNPDRLLELGWIKHFASQAKYWAISSLREEILPDSLEDGVLMKVHKNVVRRNYQPLVSPISWGQTTYHNMLKKGRTMDLSDLLNTKLLWLDKWNYKFSYQELIELLRDEIKEFVSAKNSGKMEDAAWEVTDIFNYFCVLYSLQKTGRLREQTEGKKPLSVAEIENLSETYFEFLQYPPLSQTNALQGIDIRKAIIGKIFAERYLEVDSGSEYYKMLRLLNARDQNDIWIERELLYTKDGSKAVVERIVDAGEIVKIVIIHCGDRYLMVHIYNKDFRTRLGYVVMRSSKTPELLLKQATPFEY